MDLHIPPTPQTNIKTKKTPRVAQDYVFDEPTLQSTKEIKILSNSSSYNNIPADTTLSQSQQITEDDFLKMKQQSLDADLQLSTLEKESVVSNADSVSNFEEHIDIPYDTEDEELENNSKQVVYGNFVFGRTQSSKLNLNKETVRILNYPFEPLMVPENERQEYIKCFTDSRLYLVGTAHFSLESHEDVVQTITQVKPDAVMVELCPSRLSILSMNEQALLEESRLLTVEKMITIIKQTGLLQGILHILLLSSTAHITRQLGMAPGGEFRAAYASAKDVPTCRLILGDRPIQITLQRALNALSFFQKIKLFFCIMASKKISITKEDVERCKNKDLLEELLKEMAGEFPQLTKIFVEERDLYMVHVLRTRMQTTIVEKWNTSRYENGMLENWNHQFSIDEIITIPKKSKLKKARNLLLSAIVISGTVYAGYKIATFSYCKLSNIIQSKLQI